MIHPNDLTYQPTFRRQKTTLSRNRRQKAVSLNQKQQAPNERHLNPILLRRTCLTRHEKTLLHHRKILFLTNLLCPIGLFLLKLMLLFPMDVFPPETNASVSDPDISLEINDITAHKISARLFEGSTICVDDVTVLMNAFCSRFSISDECSTKMHALIKAFLPQGNNFPNGYSQIRRAKNFLKRTCVS